jgi:hypothetical protein
MPIFKNKGNSKEILSHRTIAKVYSAFKNFEKLILKRALEI